MNTESCSECMNFLLYGEGVRVGEWFFCSRNCAEKFIWNKIKGGRRMICFDCLDFIQKGKEIMDRELSFCSEKCQKRHSLFWKPLKEKGGDDVQLP